MKRIPVVVLPSSREEQDKCKVSVPLFRVTCSNRLTISNLGELSGQLICTGRKPISLGHSLAVLENMSETIRILLVEDEEIDQVTFVRSIQREGLPYEAVIVGSVQEARSALAEQKFDVVITDYHLGPDTAFDLLGNCVIFLLLLPPAGR